MADITKPGPNGITITYPEITTPSSNSSKNENTLTDVVVTYPVINDPNHNFQYNWSNPNAGYLFFFMYKEVQYWLPVTPATLKMKIPSRNETIDLISMGEVNIVKGPGLVEFEFEAAYPMRNYPYARWRENTFFSQWNLYKSLKEKREPVYFVVTRPTKALKYHNGYKPGWETNVQVTIEDLEILEDADNGDEVTMSFKLKQYKNYGVVKLNKDGSTTSSSSEERPADNGTDKNQLHTVTDTDTLWNIAKQYYGDGNRWTEIYEANKDVIENTAKQYGKESSSNGGYIYIGTELVIPKDE